MRLLAIHADFMEYEAKKKTKFAEELPEGEGTQKVEEVLVVFTSVEKEDEDFKDEIIKRYLENLKDIQDEPRYHFIHGDITDNVLVDKILDQGFDAIIYGTVDLVSGYLNKSLYPMFSSAFQKYLDTSYIGLNERRGV